MLRRLRFILLIVVLGVLAVLSFDIGRLVLAPSRDASIAAVRIRNAMVSSLGHPDQTQWSPAAIPANFKWEQQPAPDFFTQIVGDVLPSNTSDLSDFDKALLLAYHLRVTSAGEGPIQANTRETYERIVSGQGGYCSDYSQSFNALALAAGLSVREWGFTWEEMANGHAFNEVWEPELGKWIFLDSFGSFYVVDKGDKIPLSALEFRSRLLTEEGKSSIDIVPIVEGRLGFRDAEKSIAWYGRGLPRMFLILGNNIFSYDSNPVIQTLEALPRSIELMVAIVLGEHPRFLFVPSEEQPEIREQVDDMMWEAATIFAKLLAVFILSFGLLVWLWRSRSKRVQSLRPQSRIA